MKKIISTALAGTVILSSVIIFGEQAEAKSLPKLNAKNIATTSGIVDGFSAEPYAKVYVYKGGKLLGSDIASKYGFYSVSIKAQPKGTVLTQLQAKNSVKSSKTKVKVTKRFKKVKQKSIKQVKNDTKKKIAKEMYKYLSGVAKKNKKAVSDYYFAHGAAGSGDWYGNTPNGEIQVQDQHNPGYYAFPLHDVAGFMMYTPKSGKYGIEPNHYAKITGFGGLYELYKPNTSVIKYIMADNGRVYEIKGSSYTKGLFISPSTGFGEYDNNGKRGQYGPTVNFKKTTNKALQSKYAKVFKKYTK